MQCPNKPLVTLISACILAASLAGGVSAQLVICGDVDGSQNVNIIDGFIVAQFTVGIGSFTPDQLAAADVNGTTMIEITDALRIAQFVVVLITDMTCDSFGSIHCADPARGIGDFLTINETMVVASPFTIMGDLEIEIDMPHGDIRDLTVTLIHPDATQVVLHNRTGPPSLGGIFGTYPTTLTPAGSLASLNGKPVGGTWTLRVNDGAFGDVGTLQHWCVSVGTPALAVSRTPYNFASASRTGNNLIGYPFARLTGGGIPENTIQFSMAEWSTGPNTVPELGGGDDFIIAPIAGGVWTTTLSATRGTINPTTGLFVAGDITGQGQVHWNHATLPPLNFNVAVVPPDWKP